jgi:hypothetical protein
VSGFATGNTLEFIPNRPYLRAILPKGFTLAWVSKNKRFALNRLEVCTRSSLEVSSRFPPYLPAPSGLIPVRELAPGKYVFSADLGNDNYYSFSGDSYFSRLFLGCYRPVFWRFVGGAGSLGAGRAKLRLSRGFPRLPACGITPQRSVVRLADDVHGHLTS